MLSIRGQERSDLRQKIARFPLDFAARQSVAVGAWATSGCLAKAPRCVSDQRGFGSDGAWPS
jgi:hypothetical protein